MTLVRRDAQVAGSGHAGSGREVEFGSIERVRWHLDNWSRWMRSGSEVDGFPSQTPGTVNWTLRSDLESMCLREDRRSAEITDLVIRDDLSPAENVAIHHRYGIAACYRFPRANFEVLLDSAREKIGRSLARRGIY